MKKIKMIRLARLMIVGGLAFVRPLAAQNTSNAVGPDTNSVPIEQSGSQENGSQPIVLIGQNAELRAGDTAEAVVVIGGSAKIQGNVRDAVVVIGGNAEVSGEVNDAVVAVLGNVRLLPGARIRRDAVAVLGTLSMASGSSVGGNAVSVGGKLDRADGAIVRGQTTTVGLPIQLANMEWLTKWLKYCVLEFRPLAPQVGWVWIVAGVFFLIYLFIAAFFPRPVEVCGEVMARRPATTFLIGLLTKLFVPVIYLILAATGIGLVVIPFVWAALIVAAMIGKVALLERLGFQVGRGFVPGFQKPLFAFLIGIALITLLYMVPILGLLTAMIVSTWGLGCAVVAVSGSMRREMPQKPAPQPPVSGEPAGMPAAPAATGIATQPAPFGASPGLPMGSVEKPDAIAGAGPQAAPPGSPASTVVPPVYSQALSLPRAGFWERLIAGFLDLIVIGMITAIAHGPLRFFSGPLNGPPLLFIIALIYFTGMWAWKGTTLGGSVLKLHVIRNDGGALSWMVALVRSLTAAFSIVVLFLGFFWIAWDPEKQGWHDKITGTIVVRSPRSIPLVCL